ncbi:unnamed protein product [Caenorhabditis angaria]|uniref:Uncharacterized protein n=1 Tax=Caenorhabditis angaria TaxID=860376 RepID=A0A9P1IZY6_9PELO|nr:unnamed protein product [Caenorhabditis angaria]
MQPFSMRNVISVILLVLVLGVNARSFWNFGSGVSDGDVYLVEARQSYPMYRRNSRSGGYVDGAIHEKPRPLRFG